MPAIVRSIDFGARGTVTVVEDAAALAWIAAEHLIRIANDAIFNRGGASIALSGGSTPKLMGEVLASAENRGRVDWSRVHVFWGDERWVPLESPESNAGVASRTFLDLVDIPASNVHPFLTEVVSPEESAATYEALIRTLVEGAPVPIFDLILLGMGDDGHTASLFPGTTAIREESRLVVAHHVPKLDATRLTMTPPLLNAARAVTFLAGGAGKASRLREVLQGREQIDDLPAQVIRPAAGGPLWYVDRPAAAHLPAELDRP
jgi:6-phosphogluconolactonase